MGDCVVANIIKVEHQLLQLRPGRALQQGQQVLIHKFFICVEL
jgi:hypothetical protein